MSEPDLLVCGIHGQTRAVFLCRHVFGGIACGFHVAADTPDDPWPDAWCDLCDERRDDNGDWTDAAMELADIKALCTHCYEAARARNREVPPLLRGAAAKLDAAERDRMWSGVHDHMTARQAQLEWLDGDGRWDFDEDARTLTFTASDRPTVIAGVRMVGSYSTRSGTFQWSWALYDDDDPLIAGVSYLRELGTVRDIVELNREGWACEIEEAWDVASLSGYVLGARGLYRAPFDHLYWFMLIDEIRPGSSSSARASAPA